MNFEWKKGFEAFDEKLTSLYSQAQPASGFGADPFAPAAPVAPPKPSEPPSFTNEAINDDTDNSYSYSQTDYSAGNGKFYVTKNVFYVININYEKYNFIHKLSVKN